MGRANDYICPGETTIIGRKGTINKPIYVEEPFWNVDTAFGLVSNKESLIPRYLYHFCRYFNFGALSTTSAIPSLTSKNIERIKLWLPDVDEQEVMVQNLDACLHQIKICEQSLVSFDELIKSRFVEMFGNPVENLLSWPNRKMGELGELRNGVNFKASDSGFEIKCLGVGDFKDRYSITDMGLIDTVFLSGEPTDKQMLKDGDVVFVRSNGNKQLVGRCLAVFPGDKSLTFSGFCIRFRNESDDLLLDYLLGCLKSDSMRKAMVGRGANIQNLSQGIMSEIMIPIPPLELQQDFVAFVQQVDKLKYGGPSDILSY